MEYNQGIVFYILLVIHFFILNSLEKEFSSKWFSYSTITRRPSKKCKKQMVVHPSCMGLPSGSTEITTIASLILYHYEFISLPLSGLLIGMVGLQRIIIKRHTLFQVFSGFLIGGIYAAIYIYLNLSYYCLLIPVFGTIACITYIGLLSRKKNNIHR